MNKRQTACDQKNAHWSFQYAYKKHERNPTEENLSLKVERYTVITAHDFLSKRHFVYIYLIHFY